MVAGDVVRGVRGKMKYGDTFLIKNKLKGQPEQDKCLRAMTEIIAKKNLIRIKGVK